MTADMVLHSIRQEDLEVVATPRMGSRHSKPCSEQKPASDRAQRGAHISVSKSSIFLQVLRVHLLALAHATVPVEVD